MKNKIWIGVKCAVCYVLGLCLIAIGINISKLSNLGISPVSSIPRATEEIWGFTLGTTTWIIYGILMCLQILVLRKKFKILNLLGFAVTFGFGLLVDLFGVKVGASGGQLLQNFPRPENYGMQLLYLVCSVLIIGLGVFLYLRPHFVPMPAEGLAAAISQISDKAFGDCKTLVDCSMIGIALILQFIFLGGFSSFTGETIVVREGTVVAAVCVGQVVKFLAKKCGSFFEALLFGKKDNNIVTK